ncbi:MAG: type II toxin-antitoxin system VapB family antitoxin [Betaproteobacteria bacterium]|nr:type II toxin-antitoxin system VapB family antitoxin [Betaproteobacteria bacterium]
MLVTRVFRNGNSQAVRIPAELAYSQTDMTLEIERIGDELRIRPAQRSLAGALDIFARFSPDFVAAVGDRKEQGQRERETF